MMKRVLAMLLAVVLVVSVLPVGVLAEGSGAPAAKAEQTTAEKHTLYSVQPSHAHVENDAHICEHCVAAGKTGDAAKPTWIAWGDDDAEKTKLPTDTGHYYIVGELNKMGTTDLSTGGNKDVVICLNGQKLNCNDAYNVSNRFYTLGSTNKLTVLDCTAHTDADGNYVAGSFNNGTYTSILFKYEKGNAVFTMYDGIINNSIQRGANGGAMKAGGAILVQGPSRVNLYGGQIRGAKATSGGAIRLYSKGAVLDIDGAAIVDCEANGQGSAIIASESTDKGGSNPTQITIKNAVITGNKNTALSGDDCGGVLYVNSNTAVVTLGGNNQITGNTDASGAAYDLFLQNDGSKFTVSDLDAQSRMGIRVAGNRLSAEGGLVLTNPLNGATASVANFVINNENYTAKIENDTVVMAKDAGHIHKVCNGDSACASCAHTNVTYLPWEDGTKLPTSGNYYLTTDVELSAQTDLSGTTLNLCLNGHTVKAADGKSIRHFMLANNAKLTISNCSTTEGILTGGKSSSIMTNSNAQNASVIELYNITLKGNSYTGGGAVMLQGKSDLKAVSCKFNENTGTSQAGAMRLYGTGNTTLVNCEIKGNTAPWISAVRLENGTLTLIDTVIENNTATYAGDASYGAVYMTNSDTRTLTVAGATRITGNTDANGKAYNVFFQNSVGKQGVLTIGEVGLSGNALIGITLQKARLGAADGMTVTKKLGGKNPVVHIVSDNETYAPVLRDDTVVFADAQTVGHKHNICADGNCTDHAAVSFEPWESDNSLPTTGSYYLTKDVVLSAQVKPTDTLNLCLNGHKITVKEGTGARHFYMEYAYNLNLTNCDTQNEAILTGGQASSIMTSNDKNGGKIHIGEVNLYNVVFEGNTYGNGAAMALQGDTVLTAVNCIFRNNTATTSAGVLRVYSTGADKGVNATFIDCQMTGNTASTYSAIRQQHGHVTLINTVIEGNKATTVGIDSYGAVYFPNNDQRSLTVSGTTRIIGNTEGEGKPANVVFQNAEGKQAVLTIGEGGLSGNALIGITMRDDRVGAADGSAFTGKLDGTDLTAFFTSDNEELEVAFTDDAMHLTQATYHIHKLCNDASCADHSDVKFNKWTDGTKLPTSGNYYLETDVQLGTVVNINGELNLCLNGHTVTAKKNERHFAVSGTLTITDCQGSGQITGGKRTFGGAAASVNAGGILNLYSGSLTNNQAVKNGNGNAYGGAIFLYQPEGDKPGAVFNMYGGKLTGNSSEAEGGAIYGRDGAVVNIYGGEISGNTAGTQGGAIYFAGSKLMAKDCVISGNSAYSGGAIRAAGNGTLELTNVQIKDNTVSGIASAIRMEGGTCTLKLIDTVIEGNKNTEKTGMDTYGAVFAPNNAYSIILEGQTRIIGNTDKNGDPADTYFQHSSGKQAVITVSDKGLSGEAKIGIALWTTRLAAGDNMVSANAVAEGQEAYFTATVGGYTVVRGEDGKLYLMDGHDSHNICGDAACKDHENLIWLPWNDPERLPASGNYYLNTDVQLKSVRVLNTKDLNLCLNGHTITASKNERSLVLSEGLILSITDCTDNGKITGGVRNFGGVINVNQGATFNLYGGNLTGNQTVAMTNENGKAGAVYVTRAALGYKVGDEVLTEKPESGVAYEEVTLTPGGVFNMYGGSITENKSFMGGAVHVCDGATFNLYDGTISNNATIGRGGAIVGDGRAVINIHGGLISENSGSKGGAIYVRDGAVLNISGGVITKNKTGATFVDGKQIEKGAGGAAIALTNKSVMTMTGGEISYNAGAGAGGAMIVESKGTKLILKDGKFIGNTSTSDGGAIYISTNTEFEMQGGEIKNNQSKKNGGGIYFLRSTGTISGGSITGNISKEGAGGGMAMARATVTLKGGSISYNKLLKETSAKGGGIMMNGATLNIYGGSIIGNSIGENGTGGAAICTSTASETKDGVKTTFYSTINMYGGTIAEHQGNYGGAMLLQSKTVMNMYGGTIRDNYAPKEGGAICLYSQSQFHMQGGTMTGNKTESRGGCVKFNAGTSGSFTGGTLTGNYAGQYGGVFNAHGIDTKVVMKNMKIYGNECRNYGGGIAITWNAILDMDDCEFYENKAGEGGAMYLAHKTTCHLDNVKVYNNYSTDAGGAFYLDVGNNIVMTNVEITNNEATNNGGGVYTRANVRFVNCLIDGNVSGKDGGGIATSAAWTYGNNPENTAGYIGRGQGMIIENTVISNNTCVGRGGAAFMAKKNWNTIINSTFTGNVSGETGSALFVGDDLLVNGMTVTGNTSKTDGYAVYYRENSFDGQSYMQAIHEMGGNVIVKDNVGGDMMLCEKIVICNILEGYGENTDFNVTLSDGLLTSRLVGEYNYEGGDLVYNVTYGDRSWTDPEKAVPAEQETQPEETEAVTEPADTEAGNSGLYIGIGAIAGVIVIAAVILVIAKKKKTPAGKE